MLFPYSLDGLDPSKEISFTRILKEQGYSTAMIGKWHLGHLNKYLPKAHGFDYFFGIPYPNDMGAERRFGLTNISQILPPVPLIRDTTLIKECFKSDLAELPHWFLREVVDYIVAPKHIGKPFYLQWSNIETHTPCFVPKGFEDISADGVYGDAVEYFDFCIGMVMKALKATGLDKNTLVVVHSDNGNIVKNSDDLIMAYGKYATLDSSRLHILRHGKGQTRFEGGARVSCIMRFPGRIPEGLVCDQIVTGADLFTTFIRLAGAEIPKDRVIDGKNILPLLQGNINTVIHSYFPGYQASGVMMSLRSGSWKLAIPGPKTWSIGPLEDYLLFDLKTDPGEKKNIAGSNPKAVEQLKELAIRVDQAMRNNLALPEN